MAKYNKKLVSKLGLEIVAYAGQARSIFLEAFKFAFKNELNEAKVKLIEGEEIINQAHKLQTDLLFEEANGNYSDITLLMVHGQDHLSSALLIRDLCTMIIDNSELIS